MAEGLDYSRLDGATKSKERVQIVKEFNSSSHINLCLVSTMLVHILDTKFPSCSCVSTGAFISVFVPSGQVVSALTLLELMWLCCLTPRGIRLMTFRLLTGSLEKI